MVKVRHGHWSSDSSRSGNNDIEALRDSLRGDYSKGCSTGKKVSNHAVFTETIEVSDEIRLASLLENAKKGYWQSQIMLAEEYYKLGNIKAAEYWLSGNLSSVKDPRVEILREKIRTYHINMSSNPDKSSSSVEVEQKSYSNLPLVERCKVNIFYNKKENGRLKPIFYTLNVKTAKGWYNENYLLHRFGHKTVIGLYDTYEKAYERGREIVSTWGKNTDISYEDQTQSLLKRLENIGVLEKLLESELGQIKKEMETLGNSGDPEKSGI